MFPHLPQDTRTTCQSAPTGVPVPAKRLLSLGAAAVLEGGLAGGVSDLELLVVVLLLLMLLLLDGSIGVVLIWLLAWAFSDAGISNASSSFASATPMCGCCCCALRCRALTLLGTLQYE